MTIRVLIVDDDPVVCTTLRRAFSRQPDFVVVGEAADGEAAVSLTQQRRPDVIVMDVQMPKLTGVEATYQLRRLGIDTPILFLTADGRAREQVERIERAGLLLKAQTGLAETIAAVRAAAVAH